MAQGTPSFNEKELSKGHLRKLNALRKSIGDELGTETFAKWYGQQQEGAQSTGDPNIETLGKVLDPLLDEIRIPRGAGYLVRRGRGRFIIELVE